MPRITVKAETSGKVWKIEAAPGSKLASGDVILILESMKMEIPIEAPQGGTLAELLVGEGDAVKEDQPVALIDA